MDDAGEGSRATRRQVLGATAGALAVGALSGRSSAQQASGPTVYVGSGIHHDNDSTLYAVDAATGDREWAFTQPSWNVNSSPTVADGTVYVGSRDDTLYAVDAATGTQEWAFTHLLGAVEPALANTGRATQQLKRTDGDSFSESSYGFECVWRDTCGRFGTASGVWPASIGVGEISVRHLLLMRCHPPWTRFASICDCERTPLRVPTVVVRNRPRARNSCWQGQPDRRIGREGTTASVLDDGRHSTAGGES